MTSTRRAAATLHPHAAGLYVLGDPRWRRTLWIGGLVVVTPLIGWHVVLGFRRALIARLCGGPDALPDWRGSTRGFLVDGLKASGVILAYLAPLHVLAFALAIGRGWDPALTSPWIPLTFLSLPFLLPLSLPFALIVLARGGWITHGELATFVLAFVLIVYFVPAAFLQVSMTGRFRSAFAFWRVLAFLRRRGADYTRAWIASAPIAFAAHVAVPIAPWSIVWAYCSVMFLFNEVLVASGEHGRGGWIDRARSDPRWAPAPTVGTRSVLDANGERVPVVDLRLFSAPMPWRRDG